MDQLLFEMRGQVVANSLDPMRVDPFQVKVKSTGVTTRDFKGNFTQGSMFGLSKLLRKGDCSYGAFGANMKMGCYLTLTPVEVLMNADVKGDSMTGGRHKLSTKTTVSGNTMVLVELVGRRFGQPSVDSVTVKAVTLTTNVIQGKLDLNGSRRQAFSAETNRNLATQLTNALKGKYAVVFNKVLVNKRFP